MYASAEDNEDNEKIMKIMKKKNSTGSIPTHSLSRLSISASLDKAKAKLMHYLTLH